MAPGAPGVLLEGRPAQPDVSRRSLLAGLDAVGRRLDLHRRPRGFGGRPLGRPRARTADPAGGTRRRRHATGSPGLVIDTPRPLGSRQRVTHARARRTVSWWPQAEPATGQRRPPSRRTPVRTARGSLTEHDELPDEGDELLGSLAVGGVAGLVTSKKLLLGRDAPAVGNTEQPGDEGDDGHTARGEGEADPGQEGPQVAGVRISR